MKIVILDHEPYSKRREDHFLINEFRARGVEVEFWSLWKILSYTKHVEYNYKVDGESVFYLESKKDLINKLKDLDNKTTFVFIELFFNSGTLYIFELLKNVSLRWGRLYYYYNPVVNFFTSSHKAIKTRPFIRIKNILKGLLSISYLRVQFIYRLRNSYYNSLPITNVSFITGSNRNKLEPSDKFISIDYFDIDKFNLESKKPVLLTYPYIVFADIYLGKHPDLQIRYKSPYMDIDAYYRRLNDFFSHIEKKLNMPVVIAAHPKSSYGNEFEGRLCIKNETANLIINSKLTIQHSSLSISFALLSKKKIIHFYDNEFISNPVLIGFYEMMKGISKEIDSSCINIERDFDIQLLYNRKVNHDRYEDVLQRYFKKDENEKRTNFEIVYDNIENLFVS